MVNDVRLLQAQIKAPAGRVVRLGPRNGCIMGQKFIEEPAGCRTNRGGADAKRLTPIGRENPGRRMNRHQRRSAAKQGLRNSATTPPTVAGLFAAGVAHHQAGRLPQAEACYRQLLAAQPDHADALQLMGLIAHQMGRHAVAVDLILRAIQRNGQNPSYTVSITC
jgi:tetratricopeptide (TPR) repeat protein